ncbi:hypothetical protein [Herminiimonas arsenitoxidans]|uniref:hypothetical protein n=1 Tax=Herminiimonas arsenitoxidans TaxID=1809410 RepID=UPI000970E319|nr:hypothetical protein [Herminiimonas arsenitoxidans]
MATSTGDADFQLLDGIVALEHDKFMTRSCRENALNAIALLGNEDKDEGAPEFLARAGGEVDSCVVLFQVLSVHLIRTLNTD